MSAHAGPPLAGGHSPFAPISCPNCHLPVVALFDLLGTVFFALASACPSIWSGLLAGGQQSAFSKAACAEGLQQFFDEMYEDNLFKGPLLAEESCGITCPKSCTSLSKRKLGPWEACESSMVWRINISRQRGRMDEECRSQGSEGQFRSIGSAPNACLVSRSRQTALHSALQPTHASTQRTPNRGDTKGEGPKSG